MITLNATSLLAHQLCRQAAAAEAKAEAGPEGVAMPPVPPPLPPPTSQLEVELEVERTRRIRLLGNLQVSSPHVHAQCSPRSCADLKLLSGSHWLFSWSWHGLLPGLGAQHGPNGQHTCTHLQGGEDHY